MLYFGNSRAVLGYNCAVQLPPHLVHLPLLSQRGSSASTQIQPWCVECRISPEEGRVGSGYPEGVEPPYLRNLEEPNPARSPDKLHHSLCPRPEDNFYLWTQPPPAMTSKTEYLGVFSHFFRWVFPTCISHVLVFSQLSSGTVRSAREAWFLCAQNRTAEGASAQRLLSYLPLNWQIPFYNNFWYKRNRVIYRYIIQEILYFPIKCLSTFAL